MNKNPIPLRTFILTCVVLLTIYSCSKENTTSKPAINTISDTFKSYCIFDTTSYWIYRDVNQQLTDTVMVHGHRTEQRLQFLPDQVSSYHYEAILFDYDSGNMGLEKAEIIASRKQSTGDTLYERFRLYFSNGRYYTILAPEFPLNETQLFGEQEGSYTNIAFYNQFTLNGTSYQEVYRSSVKDYLNGPDTLRMEFWLARNIGLIWFTAKNTQTNIAWSLMESDVKAAP
jgi:hypothetical protein